MSFNLLSVAVKATMHNYNFPKVSKKEIDRSRVVFQEEARAIRARKQEAKEKDFAQASVLEDLSNNLIEESVLCKDKAESDRLYNEAVELSVRASALRNKH